jgi:UDP-N-acetylglucosamine 2-epimerase (non-hydrolysing)
MRTYLYVVGARPNFVKTAPVVEAMRRRAPEDRHVLVHTGQHYDAAMSRTFFDELGLPRPDRHLGVGSGRRGQQVARVLEALEALLDGDPPDLLLVSGDVNSTLCAALAATAAGVPLAHVEAGLRSFDRTMPEELNRVLTDQLSDVLFIHSPEAVDNLVREGVAPERIHFVGNTMIDTLVRMASSAHHHFLDGGELDDGFLLVTLHRPALVDGPGLADAMRALDEVARELPVVFPVHPRTRQALDRQGAAPGRVRLLEPASYLEFVALEQHATAILTDSGGVQEEAAFLGVPCFTLRDNTERPVTITEGTNVLLGRRPDRITEIPRLLTQRAGDGRVRRIRGWDGRAAERIADVLLAWRPAEPVAADVLAMRGGTP